MMIVDPGKKSLKQHLFEDFGVGLDIAGGNGKSADDAIIINESIRDYTGAEYYIIKLIYEAIGKSWKLYDQNLFQEGNRNIDQLIIELTDDDRSTYLTDFYFDISAHFR